jgi:hypothetical protein
LRAPRLSRFHLPVATFAALPASRAKGNRLKACRRPDSAQRRCTVINRAHDIPYIAGYSVDGQTVFIDRHLPRTFRWLFKTVRVEAFLLTHEIVEKALLDELRLHYLHAHQIAVRAERDAVKAAGVSWSAYQRFTKKYEKHIEEEKLIRVPSSLDLTPYRDEKDFELLQRLIRKARSNERG